MCYLELKSRTVKTRIPHRCAWCAERIEVKSLAKYRAYTYEGEFGHDWMHPECADAMCHLGVNDEFTWMPGEFKRGKCYA